MPPVGRMLDLSSRSLHLCTQNEAEDVQNVEERIIVDSGFRFFQSDCTIKSDG